MPSSSTSTSTPPRSPRTSRRTSRSSATSRRCCPKLVKEYRASQADRCAPRSLVGADSRLAEGVPAALRGLERQRDQASGDGRGDVPRHRGRRDHHLGRRPAPDVGRAVLRLRQAAPLDQLRWPRHDGLRPALSDRRQGRPARRHGRLPRRRRQPDHDLPGARHRRAPRDPGQGLPDEQRLLRHGPPVAGALLGRPLLIRRDGPEPRLGEAGRRLRRQGDAGRRQERGRGGDARRARHRGTGAPRRPRHEGRELLPDDPGRLRPPGTWWAESWKPELPI